MQTFTLTKTKLAVGILAMAMLVPATAWATHTFTDVEDDAFYADAVEWAFDNGITTGTSATTFSPEADVTRGQNITFAKRYDDNIVQPALAELEAQIAPLANTVAFANGSSTATDIDGLTTAQTLSMTAPADGTVVVNSSARITVDNTAVVGCSIIDGPTLPGVHQQLSSSLDNEHTTLAGTRGFTVTAGDTLDLHLLCSGFIVGNADVYDATLTAVFSAG